MPALAQPVRRSLRGIEAQLVGAQAALQAAGAQLVRERAQASEALKQLAERLDATEALRMGVEAGLAGLRTPAGSSAWHSCAFTRR